VGSNRNSLRTRTMLPLQCCLDRRLEKCYHRLRQFSYLGAEDVAVCLANSIECGTTRKQMRFPVWWHQNDGYSHRNYPQIAQEYSKLKPNFFDATFCLFLMAGTSRRYGSMIQLGLTLISVCRSKFMRIPLWHFQTYLSSSER
jgi:hypothetical protein